MRTIDQLMIAERLRLLNKDITVLMQERTDILHEANNALNTMILLQQAIENIPESKDG